VVRKKKQTKILPDKNTYKYLNFQFSGNQTFRGSAYPMLKQLLIDSSKLVPNPNPAEVADGRETVFQTWVKYQPDANNPGNPS
jgi:N-acetylated-alpha-linked acidic dipeptidase